MQAFIKTGVYVVTISVLNLSSGFNKYLKLICEMSHNGTIFNEVLHRFTWS